MSPAVLQLCIVCCVAQRLRSVILCSISKAHKQVRNDKNGEDHAGNSIHRHECNVNSTQIIWLYNRMLVNQTSNKNQNTDPVQHTKMPEPSGRNNTSGT